LLVHGELPPEFTSMAPSVYRKNLQRLCLVTNKILFKININIQIHTIEGAYGDVV